MKQHRSKEESIALKRKRFHHVHFAQRREREAMAREAHARGMSNDVGIQLRVRRACKRWESARKEGTMALRDGSMEEYRCLFEDGLLVDAMLEAQRMRSETRSKRLQRSVESMARETEGMRVALETCEANMHRKDALLRLCDKYRKETWLKEIIAQRFETKPWKKHEERYVFEQALWMLHVYIDVEAQEKLFQRLSIHR